MSGVNLQRIGWSKITPPALTIDVSRGINDPNIRADNGAISIWNRNGESPRQWQHWTGIANGWSDLFTFPADYDGGVGWLVDVAGNAANPSFFTSEYLPATGSTSPAARFCQISADGTEQGNDIWWPPLGFLDSVFSAGIGLGGGFSPFALSTTQFTQSPYAENECLSFTSLADRNHLWVPLGYNINTQIISALVGFTPANGLADSVVMTDIQMQSFVQNFAHPMFLYDNSGGGVDAISYHPSGNNVYEQLRWNAPFSDLQDAVIDIASFRFGGGSITGPFIVSGDVSNSFVPRYVPPDIPTELRLKAPNNHSTRYFPNSGVPGYAWPGVDDLTGAQQQQFAITQMDAIAGPFGGVHDDKAAVTTFRFSGSGPPAALGIIYTGFSQGFQGLPIAVAFPVDIVPPFYGMVWNGGVYLIDSATPTQMFALSLVTSEFAGLYDMVNYVKMG